MLVGIGVGIYSTGRSIRQTRNSYAFEQITVSETQGMVGLKNTTYPLHLSNNSLTSVGRGVGTRVGRLVGIDVGTLRNSNEKNRRIRIKFCVIQTW